MRIYFWLVLLITIISLIGIGQSLNFALNGDDWLALWRFYKDFTSYNSFLNFKNYSNDYSNYLFADLLMGLISKIFSYNPFPYYFISMLFRIIASLSFYFMVFEVTKNKLTGGLSSILFASMFAGIETTNWVFNMNTYLAIIVFNLFLLTYFTWRNKEIFSKEVIIQVFLLTFAFFIAPTRMHGLLFLIPLLGFLKIQKLSIKNILHCLLYSLVLYLPILFFRFITRTSNDLVYFETFFRNFKENEHILVNLLTSLGYAFIPDKIFTSYIPSLNLQAFIVLTAYILIVLFLYKFGRRYPHFINLAIVSLFIPILFLIIPFLINPQAILSSDHRYQIVPGGYLLVLFSIICTIMWNHNNHFFKTVCISLLLIIFSINLLGLNNYFNYLSKEGRLIKDSDIQFHYLKSQIRKPANDVPIVLLFIPDDPLYLYNSITFGIQYHLMLTDPRFGLDIQKAPFAVDDLKSLVNVLSGEDNSELKRYGYQPVKIPKQNAYIFTLQKKILTNITPQAQAELIKLLPNSQ